MTKTYTISGTEIGSILGLNPYQTPMDLYMRKLGLIDPPEPNEAMLWGSAAEHVVARRYAKETKHTLIPSTDVGYDYKAPLTHPDYPWWIGTPDRKISTGPGLLEIKIVGERMAHQWGNPPDGDVPEQYLTQMAYYFPLLGVEWGDLAVQIGNRDYRVYRINRDREFEDQLRDAALAFINDHLIPQIPPAIDGSESSKRYLNYKYPKDQGPVLESTDEFVLATLQEYRQVRDSLKKTEEYESHLQNTIKAIIGNNAGIKCPAGRATWTANKDSVKIDYEKVGLDMAEQLGLAMKNKDLALNIYADFKLSHSIIKPGARVFRVQFPKEVL